VRVRENVYIPILLEIKNATPVTNSCSLHKNKNTTSYDLPAKNPFEPPFPDPR
jgi:hypothetical protein